MIIYSKFFKQYGVRLPTHLASPRIRLIENFQCPKDTILHYLPETINEIGIASDSWLLRNNDRLSYAVHVDEITKVNPLGKFRKSKGSPISIIKDYHKRNRKVKLAKSLDKIYREPKSVVTVNYGLIPQLYNYTKNVFSLHNSRMNIIATVCDNVNVYNHPNRNSFIVLEVGDIVPSLTALRKADSGITSDVVTEFNDLSSCFILDLWRWLGLNRKSSNLSRIKLEHIPKTNIILKKDEKILVLNLGVLDAFRGDPEKPNFKTLRLRLLNAIVTLIESDPASVVLDDHNENISEVGNNADLKLKKNESEELENLLDAKHDAKVELQGNVVLKPLDSVIEKPLPETFLLDLDSRLDKGELTLSEHKRLKKNLEKFLAVPNPLTGKGKLVTAGEIKPEDLTLPPVEFVDRDKVIDKSMLASSTDAFDRLYTEKVMDKDIINSVTSILKAGNIVTGYEIENVKDIMNDFTIHTVKVMSSTGKQSTLTFKIPKIDSEGNYLANGVKYRMRKQRGDNPIRKINSSTVALTSNYGKTFISRDDRARGNYGGWLIKEIKIKGSDKQSGFKNLVKNTKFDLSILVPRIYSILGQEYLSFQYKNFKFDMDYGNRKNLFPDLKLRSIEGSRYTLIGKYKNFPLLVDSDNALYYKDEDDVHPLGSIEEALEIDATKKYIDSAIIKVFSAKIPLGFVLAYYVGLDNLLASLKGDIKKVQSNVKYALTPNEYSISFEDTTLILNTNDALTTLLMHGFKRYEKTLKQYPINLFNKDKVYLNILSDFNLGVAQLNELDLMRDMFIDPITEEILKTLDEPTQWIPLLKRSAELLLTDQTLKETDLRNMRIKGYERMSAVVYKELIRSIRAQRRFGGALELNPYAVWKEINSDPAITLVEESNPIKNINERESVTFLGTGGRSRESMVGRTRIFNPSDKGVISEATVDSGDVAINTYLSSNPNLVSLRGNVKEYDKKDGPASLLSTAAMLSPGADVDSPARVNFITIQHAQGIAANGYVVSPIRTGAEEIIPERTGKLFCTTATQNGVVVKRNKLGITVEYDDGSFIGVKLGTEFGSASGATYKHTIESNFNSGDKISKGDAIAYNTQFFAPDFFNPKRVIWKGAVLAKVALLESSDTFEDSSAISEELSRKLSTYTTKVKHIVVGFDKTINGLVSVGDTVDTDSILCTIEDPVTADNNLFSEENINTLKLLSGNAPKAKTTGTVEKIEVLYYGDKEYMSPSVLAIADNYDRELAKSYRAINEKPITGKINDSVRINNTVLETDHIVIKVYISDFETDGVGTGDKGVFANQMKTIFGSVMSGINRTESGADLDAFFGYMSIVNRQVNSPELIGTSNTLLKVISKHVSDVYFGKK